MKNKYSSIALSAFLFLSALSVFSQTAPTQTSAVPAATPAPTQTVAATPTVAAKDPTVAPADEGIYRHTRFGIRVSPSYNSFNVLSKTMSNEGGVAKFGAGLLMETRLTKNVEFQTGLGVDVFGGKITYSNNPTGEPTAFTNRFLYNSPDETIIKYDLNERGKTGNLEYMLMERTYKITYITVPINLRMKTNNINGFKYFGQIGVDLQFRWSGYVNDKARLITGVDNPTTTAIELGEAQDLSKVKLNEDISFMNVAINTGIGAQYEVGGVDLFLALNYHFGIFSPVHKETEYTKKVYQTTPGTLDASNLKQEYRTRVFALTLGFMF